MAIFLARLTVPAATPLTTPASQELQTIAGQLINLRVYIPPGPRGELYLRLFHRGVQIAPSRVGTWWRPDNVVLNFPLDYPISKGDTIFYLQGVSPTASFQHAVDFELFVQPGNPAQAIGQPSGLLSRISDLFGG